MSNLIIGIGALSAFISVAAGAFGAHALKQVLDSDMLAVYHTAVEYQFFHSIGLLAVGTLHKLTPRYCNLIAAWAMLAGIIIFSGSLYLLTMTGIKWLGMITPIGGISFLAAWLSLALGYLTARHNRED
ncbi:MAG: DUF423 domain-containing protein [Gammaproteobacteria bacterium]|jgi:uncharacterized membrane protein YgdD (TMEM256/DUF423 family)